MTRRGVGGRAGACACARGAPPRVCTTAMCPSKPIGLLPPPLRRCFADPLRASTRSRGPPPFLNSCSSLALAAVGVMDAHTNGGATAQSPPRSSGGSAPRHCNCTAAKGNGKWGQARQPHSCGQSASKHCLRQPLQMQRAPDPAPQSPPRGLPVLSTSAHRKHAHGWAPAALVCHGCIANKLFAVPVTTMLCPLRVLRPPANRKAATPLLQGGY